MIAGDMKQVIGCTALCTHDSALGSKAVVPDTVLQHVFRQLTTVQGWVPNRVSLKRHTANPVTK